MLVGARKESYINSKSYLDKSVFFHGILSCNPKMHKLFETICKAAKTDASIYISGETGVGKELVARAIHAQSPRADQPFIAVNVANFSSDLLESQLFGHKKGAFTGAHNNSKGLLSAAENGTLFLDEVACLASNTQAKLLRVLQEKQFYPVGDVRLQSFSACVISASNLSLEDAIKQQFREDLRYRLEVIPLLVPPLRERKVDIILLFEHFLSHASTRKHWIIESDLKNKLINYSWPGNVRELENCAKFTAAMSNSEELLLSNLPDSIQIALKKDIPQQLISDEVKKITQALIQNCSNKTKTAKLLGISRMTLWRKMKTHNL